MKFQRIHQEDSLHKNVVSQIERRILDKELKPGDRLPNESELAKQFGVSRTVIREAIMMLRQARLVEVRHGVGTFITEPLPEHASEQLTQLFYRQNKSIWEVHEVRRILEPELAAIAAERISREDLAELKGILTQMQESCDNAERFVELDQAFHNAIAAATQNAMFSLILMPVMNIILENRKLGSIVPGAMEQTVVDHDAVVKAIEAKDPMKARLAMIEHLHRVTRDIKHGAEHLQVQDKPE